jgi:DNA-binding beta-propeller fold protein YncE
MLALIYLGVAIYLGERLCRRFYRFVSLPHRWAAGVLVGLLLSSGFTYLAARLFAQTSKPLIWGDLVFFATASGVIFLLNRTSSRGAKEEAALIEPRVPGSEKWDWVMLGIFLVIASWMMFATFNFKGANLQIGNNEWSDFGPNTAIIQSFAVGHNFPTEYPHFSGKPIRYHFLFYFQAGNLEFLGLNLAWSLNLLSILTLVCMLALLMALGHLLFNSRAVGRIGASLFFFHGTLSFVAFLRSQTSIRGALQAIWQLRDFLASGYPYRGETWGIWTQVVFLNQRHLASGVGIFLIVLIFLIDRYRQCLAAPGARPRPGFWRRIYAATDGMRHLASRATSVGRWSRAGSDDARTYVQAETAPESYSPPESETMKTSPESYPPPEHEAMQTAPGSYRPSESEAITTVPESYLPPDGDATQRSHESYLPPEGEATQTSHESYLPPEHEAMQTAPGSYPSPESEAMKASHESYLSPEDQATETKPGPHPSPEDQPTETTGESYVPTESQAMEAEGESYPPAEREPIQPRGPYVALTGEIPPRVSFRARAVTLLKETVSDRSFIFSGFLLGALPFWNAMVFTSAFAVLACFFILFPCRRYMVGLGLTTAVIAFPQILFLRASSMPTPTHSLLHWGYVLGNPSLATVAKYLGFTFGVKWLLIALALIFGSWFHRRFFLAICSLFVLTFCFQFSIEALANHKFLNVWLILSNLFVAYALWRLWRTRIRGLAIVGRITAVLLAIPVVAGGIIDLVPIHNSYWVEITYVGDPLIEWVRTHTKPNDVFLSERFINHQILLAGRRIFYGWPSYAWGSGYDTGKRDREYLLLFQSTDPQQVFQLLHDNNITYVAFDDGIRHDPAVRASNETLYTNNFPKVYQDSDNKYRGLVIYQVPPTAPAQFNLTGLPTPTPTPAPITNMFHGGAGKGKAQFDFPRGIAVDPSGNVLVSDTNNGRIQKFAPNGEFMSIMGKKGKGKGELFEANGIAVDKGGNIYVADVTNHRVQKWQSDGTFIAEWKGPGGFYGPRDVALGADDSVYVVDQGRSRIVKFSRDGEVLTVWGTEGKDDGQFRNPNAIAVDEKTGKVYVADPINRRIQVFDADGKFIAKWTVQEWQPTGWAFQDLVIDSQAARLYASSVTTEEVLVFDLAGTKLGTLRPAPPDKLEGVSSLALANGKLYVLDTFANRVSQIDLKTK